MISSKFTLTTLVACLLFLASVGEAGAAVVSNQNDSGPGSLRKAIEDASEGETISVPAGTYTLTSEELEITKSLSLVGHAAGDTVIQPAGPFSIIQANGSYEIGLSRLTLRGVHGPFPTGAVSALSADLTLSEMLITENTTEADGGPGEKGKASVGSGIESTAGSVTVLDSVISKNRVTANGGSGAAGGTAIGAGISYVGSKPVRIERTTFTDNVAEALGGQGTANAVQTGGVAEGAALSIVGGGETASRIIASTFSGNLSDASAGPGAEGGTAQGGAVTIVTSSPVEFSNSTVTGNSARALSGSGSNRAAGGGLVLIGSTTSPILLTSDTIADNRLEGAAERLGGNLYAEGPWTSRDTILSGGQAAVGEENCSGTAVTSLGFNLESADSCGFHAAGDQVKVNPLLGPLQDNGGPTLTMAPGAGSPAIDQGVFALPTDQRALSRPVDFPSIPNPAQPGADGSDIGSVEVRPSSALTLGKPVLNKKKGTATVTITLPQPSGGSLSLSGKKLKPRHADAGAATLKLTLAVKGGAAKKLRKKGKLKVRFDVTYAPIAGVPSASKSGSVKLVRRHKKHKPKRHGHATR